jgi:putative membrane protein
MLVAINFVTYFGLAILLTLFFTYLYEWVTPYNGFELMKQHNMSAVVSFAGALLGFVIPLASIITNSQSIGDVTTWGVVAMVIQLMVYVLARILIPELKRNVTENNIAGSFYLAIISLIIGILNAACMTY